MVFRGFIRDSSLKARAGRSSVITIASYGMEQALRLLSNVILASLLFPEAFGIMAIATVIMIGLNMISDSGIHHSIIQNKKGAEEDFRNTAWTLQIYRGIIIFLVACACAYPIASFYEEEILFPIICLLGFVEAIRGFRTTSVSLCAKNLNLAKVALLKVVVQVGTIIFMVAWVLVEPTIWALVAGAIFGVLIDIPLGHRLLNDGFKHKFAIDRQSFGELFGFGKWIFVSSIVGFIASHSDRLIVGKAFEIGDVGLYAIAYTLAYVPWIVFNKLSNDVLMPIYSEIQSQNIADIRKKMLKIRASISSLLLIPCLFLMIFGQEIIELLYDDRYLKAGWMLEVLVAGVAITVATNVGPIYLGLGKPKVLLLVTMFKALSLLSAMLIGHYYMGAIGLVIGVAASHLLNYIFLIGVYLRFKLWIWKLDILFLLLVGLSFFVF